MKIIDVHSHWGTKRGYPLQTEEELAQQRATWNSEPTYHTEAEMAAYFRDEQRAAILDFGFTKFLPLEEMRALHDYAFETERAHRDVILGHWIHIDPAMRRRRRARAASLHRQAHGFIGFAVSGSLAPPPSDPAWFPFYDLCIEAGIPALIFVGTTGLGAGLPGGGGVILDHCHPRHLDWVAATISEAEDRRRAAGLAVAGRNHRRADAQAEHLVRAARLVAEVPHRRPQARHSAPAEGSHHVRRRLSAVHLRAAGARLARRRLSGRGARERVPPQRRTLSRRGGAHMDLELKDKIAIVGGASMGIGYGIARTLAQRRRDGRHHARGASRRLSQAAEQHARRDRRARCCRSQADCRSAEDCKRVVETVGQTSAASTSWSTTTARRRSARSLSFDDAAWHKAVEQNLMYVVRMVREAVPHMQRARRRQHPQHHGDLGDPADSRLRPVGRDLGRRDRLTPRRCRSSWRSTDINVNTICPGYIDTTRLEKVFAAGGEPAERRAGHGCARDPDGAHRHGRRHRQPRRAAGVAERPYITGTTIQVDGGLLRAVR